MTAFRGSPTGRKGWRVCHPVAGEASEGITYARREVAFALGEVAPRERSRLRMATRDKIAAKTQPEREIGNEVQTMSEGIRSVEVQKNAKGDYSHVRLVFGPHYFVELQLQPSGGVDFVVGATHHGFKADASQVNGELERIIQEIRAKHPANVVD